MSGLRIPDTDDKRSFKTQFMRNPVSKNIRFFWLLNVKNFFSQIRHGNYILNLIIRNQRMKYRNSIIILFYFRSYCDQSSNVRIWVALHSSRDFFIQPFVLLCCRGGSNKEDTDMEHQELYYTSAKLTLSFVSFFGSSLGFVVEGGVGIFSELMEHIDFLWNDRERLLSLPSHEI